MTQKEIVQLLKIHIEKQSAIIEDLFQENKILMNGIKRLYEGDLKETGEGSATDKSDNLLTETMENIQESGL